MTEAQPPTADPAADAAAALSDSSASDDADDEQDLSGSELGRQAYWEEAYRTELANFEEHGNEGEVWFGREVLDTAVKWTGDLLRHCYGAAAQEMWILDVGCGNATMLVGLAAQGFTNLAGQDYSGNSVVLARKVLQKYGLRHRIRQEDLLNCDYGEGFDVITDKGTLDAIGLSDNPDGRRQYRSSVWHLLHPTGLLIITSCNSTKEELEAEFCSSDRSTKQCAYNWVGGCTHTHWHLVDWVKTYPKFEFGGVEGSKVCTVAFGKCPP